MKFRNNSIKKNILIHFATFSAIIIVFLWLFQIILLKPFYRNSLITSLKNVTSIIVNNIDERNLKELVVNSINDRNISVRILSTSNNTMDLYFSDNNYDSTLLDLNRSDLLYYYQNANENNGIFYRIMEKDDSESFSYAFPFSLLNRQIRNDYCIYTRVFTVNKTEYMSLAYCRITPIEEVSGTLAQQLLVISLLFVVLSFLFTYFISRNISDPLIKTNQKARKLAEGNYELVFDDMGYKEINELNDTLTYASKELKKVDDLQHELISNISHDLKTPLTMISGYAEMMKDIPQERTEENLQIIIDESNRLNELVNDILDNSLLQNAEILNKETISFNELVHSILDRYVPLYEGMFEFRIEESEDMTIAADKSKLQQVIYNLLNNAINYSFDSNQIDIRLYKRENNCCMDISNYGETIEPEKLNHIFERYYRSSSNHARQKAGSGIGLSIVKKVIELHDGVCTATSCDNKTTFTITLPLKKNEIVL